MQGRAHGEALREAIARVREHWRASLSLRFGVHPDVFIEAFLGETNFVDAIRRWCPAQLEEIEGIAEGSGRSLHETLAFQFMDEEWWFGVSRFPKPAAPADHCSVIAIRARDGRPPILAQNMDLRAYLDDGQAVISTVRHGGPRTTVMTICGMIGLCGANDAGLGVVVNTLWQLPSVADGLPVACVMREILEHRDAAAVSAWIRKPRHASGQSYVVGDPARFASFEASAAGVDEVPWERSPSYVHTNHPLCGNARVRRAEENSRGRYQTLCDLSAGKSLTIEEVKSALSSSEGPHPISVRPELNDPTSAMTFASIVMELKHPPQIQFASGPPRIDSYTPLT
jgi:hypothetical protein